MLQLLYIKFETFCGKVLEILSRFLIISKEYLNKICNISRKKFKTKCLI